MDMFFVGKFLIQIQLYTQTVFLKNVISGCTGPTNIEPRRNIK